MTLFENPTQTELLEALARFLRKDLITRETETSTFRARVAENVVHQLVRENRVAADADEWSAGELQKLGHASEAALASAIRTAPELAEDPAIVAYLERAAVYRLRVVNPRYLGAEHRD